MLLRLKKISWGRVARWLLRLVSLFSILIFAGLSALYALVPRSVDLVQSQLAMLDTGPVQLAVGELRLVRQDFWYVTYEIRDLEIGDEFGGWRARIPQIILELDLLGSTSRIDLHLAAVQVPQPVDVQVAPWKLRSAGDISLDDIHDALELVGDFVRLDSLSVPEVSVRLLGQDDALLETYRFTGTFRREGGDAALQMDAFRHRPGDAGEETQVLQARGSWDISDSWRVRGWLRNLDLAAMLERPLQRQGLRELAAELEFDVAGTELVPDLIVGQLRLPLLRMDALPWDATMELPQFEVRFASEDAAVEVETAQIIGRVGGAPLQMGRIQLAVGKELSSMSLQVAEQQVQAVVRLVRSLVELPQDIDSNLAQLDPSGYVRQFHARAEFAEIADFTVSAEIDQLSANPTDGGWPGWTGLSGELFADASGGVFIAKPLSMELNVESYFSPWPLRQVSGEVAWHIHSDSLVIYTRNVQAALRDGGQGAVDIGVHLPFDGGADDARLDLIVQASDMPLNGIELYIPRLDGLEGLEDYIKQAQFSGGGALKGAAVWVELTAAGISQVHLLAEAEEMGMDYAPNWSRLERGGGELELLNNDVWLKLHRGEIRGVQVGEADIKIGADPKRPEWLEIQMVGDFYGDLGGGREFLLHSDLREYVEAGLIDAQMSGDMRGVVRRGIIWIPPGADTEVENFFDIVVDIEDGFMEWPEWYVRLENTNGRLFVHTEDNVRSEGLTAEVFGRPAQLQISGTGAIGEPESLTWVEAQGAFDDLDLEPWMEEWAQYLRGTSEFSAKLTLPYHPERWPEIEATSDLFGMELQLPQPLAKDPNEVRTIDLKMLFTAEDDLVRLHVDTEGVCADLFNTTEDIGGRAWFNNTSACEASRRGALPLIPLEMYGRLEYIVMEELQDFFDRFPEDDDSSGYGVVEVDIANMEMADMVFDDLSIRSVPAFEGDQIYVSGEQVLGEIYVPEADDKFIVSRLERLYLPGFEGPVTETDPSRLGLSRLLVEDFRFEDVVLGSLGLETVPDAEGVRINVLPSTIGVFSFRPHPRHLREKPHFYWRFRDEEQASVELRGHLRITGPELFSLVGEQPYVTRLRTADAVLDLSWQGTPGEIRFGSLNGNVNFQARDIALNLKPISSVGPLLTLLSVLNVGTLLESAFTFQLNRISGTWFQNIDLEMEVTDGLFNILDARAESPNTSIYSEGKVKLTDDVTEDDIVAGDLDLRMQIYLPLAKSLPWYTVAVASLPAGVGIYLLNLLLGDPLSQATVMRMHLGGTLAEPEFVSASQEAEEPRIWVKDLSVPYAGSLLHQ